MLVRIFWCELHGFATGADIVGLDVSMPWALKASSGWILAGALLGLCGGRVLDSAFAARYALAGRAGLVAGVLVVTLVSETWLLSGDTPLPLWLYERGPAHATFAALLMSGYLFLRRKPTTNPASTESCMLDVMTGTGRTRAPAGRCAGPALRSHGARFARVFEPAELIAVSRGCHRRNAGGRYRE